MLRKERPDTETCLFCKEWVTDGREVSGYTGLGPDWMLDGDFGCDYNPITCEEGCGPHWTLYDATGLYIAAEWDGERQLPHA